MRRVLLFAALGAVVLATLSVVTGFGPWPDPEGCEVTVEGRTVELDPDQAEHATTIALIGLQRGLPARAVSIALAAAYQESKIRNITHGDRDSVGLFQQRPSQGWGSVEEIMDPVYAATQFFVALEKIDGFQDLRITEAAQAVQRSGYPEAYEKHADSAKALASALSGYSSDHLTCVTRDTDDEEVSADIVADVRRAFGKPAGTLTDESFVVQVDAADEAEMRRGWSLAQYLVAHADRLGLADVSFDGRTWSRGDQSEDGWRTAETEPGRIEATLVQSGQTT